MNEITRIHIAKTPYDIEIAAKKELEKYIDKLQLYADDDDWPQDIEIRITELLAERGVESGGIVTSDDVKVIREQLGDPKEFLGDGDIAIGSELEKNDSRRLYRDLDTAVLGGVLGGIAKYFNVNPMWIRLLFIASLFVSFGTAAILYIILWLVIPPARTAAEKLQLAGKPITLSSIKELREQENESGETNHVAAAVSNIIIYGSGMLFAIGAVSAFFTTIVAGGIGLLSDSSPRLPFAGALPDSWEIWTAYVLFIISGLLLTTLLSATSYALLKKKLTKRMRTIIISVTFSGAILFTVGIGAVWYGDWREDVRISSSQATKTVNLSEDFKNVKNLIFDTGSADTSQSGMGLASVQYIVDGNKPRYELTSSSNTLPTIVLSQDNATATLSYPTDKASNGDSPRHIQPVLLTIYGPALGGITVESGSAYYYNKTPQDKLDVTAKNGLFGLSGTYKNVLVRSNNSASIGLGNATVDNLSIIMAGGSVTAGVIRELTVEQTDVCPAGGVYGRQNRVAVSAIAGSLKYNGALKPVKTITNDCGEVTVGDQNEYNVSPGN